MRCNSFFYVVANYRNLNRVACQYFRDIITCTSDGESPLGDDIHVLGDAIHIQLFMSCTQHLYQLHVPPSCGYYPKELLVSVLRLQVHH